ncbi:MAG: aminotransferase class III-fold pyridoxal phosphate-dependent enzyme [Pigmentiphaga sp.]|nr:aminotransferase class III-fold pyridoxal phosphate-dependent enzyme [Pigmentiphaga sp.]
MVGDISKPRGARPATGLVFISGEGCVLRDASGRSYLDFTSGLWNVLIGHGRHDLANAGFLQASRLAYHATFQGQSNGPSEQLTQRLLELLKPEGAAKLLFCGSDTEVTETALKLARHYWKLQGQHAKTHIISMRGGHHGYHFASLAASDNPSGQAACAPGLSDFSMITGPIDLLTEKGETAPETSHIICQALEAKIHEIGANRIAAFIAEPVQGPAGVVVPPRDLWPRLREICSKHKILLIADEVITGFGRTGQMFGIRHWNVRPDIMTLGKGLTSGYASLGCIAICGQAAEALATTVATSALRSLYFETAQPLPAAVALANLDVLAQENLIESAAPGAAWFTDQARKLALAGHIEHVRSIGLMWALKPAHQSSLEACAQLQGLGLLTRPTATHVLLTPPLVVSPLEYGRALEAIKSLGTGTGS